MKRILTILLTILSFATFSQAQTLPTLSDIKKEAGKNLKQQSKLFEKQTEAQQRVNALKQHLNNLPSTATEAKAQVKDSLEKATKQLGGLNQALNKLKKQEQALRAKAKHIQEVDLKKETLEKAKKQSAAHKEKLIQKTPDDAQLILHEKPHLSKQLFLETGAGLILKDNVAGHLSTVMGLQVSNRFAFGLGGEFRNYLANGEKIDGLWSGKLMGQFNLTKNIYLRAENYAGIPSISKLKESKPLSKWAWAQMGGFGFSLPAFNGKLIKLELLKTINQQHTAIGQQLYSPYKAQLNFQF